MFANICEMNSLIVFLTIALLNYKKVVRLGVFMKMYCLGDCTGISLIDSTALKSCHYKRERQHIFLLV